jgi:NAD binding domain of 6-phosphogluconate dehydrogenase
MAGTHEPVAVLGIGAMGHGMAASALRAGIPVIVWNRIDITGKPGAVQRFRQLISTMATVVHPSSPGTPPKPDVRRAGDLPARRQTQPRRVAICLATGRPWGSSRLTERT